MPDTYEQACQNYRWGQAWQKFEGCREGTFNAGHEILGKHADEETLAVRIVDFDSEAVTELSYAELHDDASRFANYLENLGLSNGDIVAGLLSPMPELYTTISGTWLGGFVYMPLFELFGPEAVNYRLEDAQASVVVTTPDHREKIDESIESLEAVIVVGGDADAVTFEDVAECDTGYEAAETTVDDDAIIQYSSGTTGDPKGVRKTHKFLVAQHPYSTYAVDFRSDDNYFGGAPPAWSYGLNMCLARPLHLGIGTTMYRGEFNPEAFVDVLEEYEITNLFAPPTALRMTADADLDFESREFDVRVIATAGESLDSNTVEWGRDTFGVDILDHYGFTEGGMVVVNYPFDDWEVKPGSMGKPTPGFDVEVLELNETTPVEAGEVGELAIRNTDKPSPTVGYLNLPNRSAEMFEGEWMRSGDLARVDDDGYFWHEGRADDVIISSGYRIGPTEVEDSLMKHDAVAEAAVVGRPDEKRGEVVTGYVQLSDGQDPSPELADEIKQYVRTHLSKHEYPRRIEFVGEFPRTSSGKIKRKDI